MAEIQHRRADAPQRVTAAERSARGDASRDQPRLAVIGCGAIAREFHLPAIGRQPALLDGLVLVDPDMDRARELGRELGVQRIAGDFREILGAVDGAIVCTPHRLHHPIALECLRRGVHVLCEKPLSESAAQVRELIAESRRTGARIAVNNTRRLRPTSRKIAELLRSGAIGELRSIDLQEGDRFDWPIASGFAFGRSARGRGVLLDVGAHVLDLICWWLGGRPRIIEYLDDSCGGGEAVAHLRFEHGACAGNVRLSWLTRLRNGLRIVGEEGAIEAGTYDWRSLILRSPSGKSRTLRLDAEVQTLGDLRHTLLDNFLQVIGDGAAPLVSAEDVLPSIELIEACYASRRRFSMPWLEPSAELKERARRGPERVLVTGAGGFIGGRVVEVLHQAGLAGVRPSVRRWASAPRIGRLPVEIVQCDVIEPDQVDAAVAGVEGIVHCATGDREVIVDGTRNLLEAALRHRVRRVVYLSSVAVYGEVSGQAPEESPLAGTGSEYADSKIEAERLCREYAGRGLPVTILRPTIVYGPFSDSWTTEFAGRLRSGSWLLSEEDCDGTCNLLYVDDLVAAILLALGNEGAAGEAFNVNGPDRPTWNEYFRALNEAMGLPPFSPATRSVSRASGYAMAPLRRLAKFLLRNFSGAIMALYKRYDLVKRAMRGVESAIRKTPTTAEFRLYAREVSFPTAKAERRLGYRPAFDMQTGVSRSAGWLRHHGMAGSLGAEVVDGSGE